MPQINTPFELSAEEYLDHGFFTFPVMGKDSPSAGRTGNGGRCDEETVRKDLRTGPPHGHHNIAIRHDGTVAIDVDEYNDRHGVSDLVEFARQNSLPRLPATWSSTARNDTRPQSRQYFYTLPDPDVRLIGKLADGVDICQRHHRYSVVHPSVHPEGTTYEWFEPGLPGVPPTWGKQVQTVPHRDNLPDLPEEWVVALLNQTDSATVDYGIAVADVEDLLSRFEPGEPCVRVERAWEVARGHSGTHDTNRDDMFKAFRLGLEGHPGAADLVRYVAQQRHDYCVRNGRDNTDADVSKRLRDTSAHAQRIVKDGENTHETSCLGSAAQLITLAEVRALSGRDPEETPAAEINVGFVSAPTSDSWDDCLGDSETGEVDSPFVLPDSVWETSDEMRAIRQAAYARQVSPDVVLHGCFALISSLLHPLSTLETGTGTTPLSYYAAAVGRSGTGKTKGFACAEALMRDWVKGRRDNALKGTPDNPGYYRAELGTGEGMVEAFTGMAEEWIGEFDEHGEALIDDESGKPMGRFKKVRKQVRGNVMFVADEGRKILETARRPGATIMSTLCSLWSAASAGSSNAKTENTRTIEADSYVLGMFVGFQPNTMDDLFGDAGGGAPQRFLFASAAYPRLPEERTPFPTFRISPQIAPDAPLNMILREEEQDYVWKYGHQVSKGIITLPDLDGHRNLLRCRVAALLTILHARGPVTKDSWVVPKEFWDLAKVIVDTSCDYRDHLAQRAELEAAEIARRHRETQIEIAERSAAAVSRRNLTEEAMGRIIDLIEASDDADCTVAKIKKRLTGTLRKVSDAALQQAYSDGRLELVTVDNPKAGPKTIKILRVKD